MHEGYAIIDEPRSSTLSLLSVSPLWILLGGVLGGSSLAFPWFLVNSFAIGSATRLKEGLLVASGLLGSVLLSCAILWLRRSGIADGPNFKYAIVGLIVFKLAHYYLLQAAQSRSFELYQHSGGKSRSGLLLVVFGAIARSSVLGALNSDLWFLSLV